MKLITIEEPEKPILEPVSEELESSLVVSEKLLADSPMPPINESEGEVEVKNGSSEDVIKTPPTEAETPPTEAKTPPTEPKQIEKSPLTRKRSGRIKTKSKVETAV